MSMNKLIALIFLSVILTLIPPLDSNAGTAAIRLGNDVLLTRFPALLEGKKIGLVTNQTGVNSQGLPIAHLLRQNKTSKLTALFAPEHGIDGKAPAGLPVPAYTHPVYRIPVYSLYGSTRMPTREMLQDVDVLLFDIQDIGARSYTHISMLQSCMLAAKQNGKQIIVLDRPNPLGGTIVEGPVLEESLRSSIGADTLPMAHGMTIGELSLFFNRKIGADLTVIPMEGYTRDMIFQDTGLVWIPPSPDIPDIESAFGYMATGMGAGTGIVQADHYKWIGGTGIDSVRYAERLTQANLPGVAFTPEYRGSMGGVRLNILDPHRFNPAKTGLYALTYAREQVRFAVPTSGSTLSLFDMIMGSNNIGEALEKGLTMQQTELLYARELSDFREQRKTFLIYDDHPYAATQPIRNKPAVAPKELPRPNELPGLSGKTPEPAPPVQPAGKPAAPKTPAPASKPAPSAAPAARPASQLPSKPAAKPADKIAYLTFDDGPSPVTRQVLDILKQHGVKATFFVVGKNVPGNEAILKRMIAEGHVIGGHTYSHNYRIIYKDIRSFFADLEQGNRLIEKATGVKPVVFRFPGGSTNSVSKKYQDPQIYNKHEPVMREIKAEAKRRGYTFIDWNIDNGDAKSNVYTAAQAVANIKQQVKNQKELVILMHDSTPKLATARSLPAVIQYLKAEGYRFDVLQEETPTVAGVR